MPQAHLDVEAAKGGREGPFLLANETAEMISFARTPAFGALGMAFLRPSAFVAAMWALTAPAAAQAPVAIVEEVTGNPPGIAFMDYVEAGKIIQLGPDESIVLSYLNSCLREAIRGGAVKVGLDQSEAMSAQIVRTKVDCEAGKMMRAVGQSSDSASLIIRGKRPPTIRPAPAPEFTLYGLSPLIELKGGGRLVIARLDRAGEYFALTIEPKQLGRGAFLDLAADGRSLTAGGVYGARWNGRLTVFKVDPNAKPGQAPIIGRLLRLGSAS